MDNIDALVKQCRLLYDQSKEIEAVVQLIRSRGCSKVESIVVVAKMLGVDMNSAKELVHTSKAWEESREQDERFHEDLEIALKRLTR